MINFNKIFGKNSKKKKKWQSPGHFTVQNRSSHQRCSVRKENSKNSQENTCARVSFLKRALKACNFIKKRLWHRCFPVNFAKFLRTPFSQNTSGRLLLFIIKDYHFHQKLLSSNSQLTFKHKILSMHMRKIWWRLCFQDVYDYILYTVVWFYVKNRWSSRAIS